jgi:hypothetical protein
MTQQELQWLKDICEYYIIPGRERTSTALHCDHWTKLLYLHLKSKRNKEILSNESHSVLSLDGMYIDIELNAFIVDFDWKTRSIDSTAVFKPINPDFKVLRDQIFKYYSKPATEGHHLWHNKVF